ncbi:STAS domain-containing protein [Planosporangium mesophilum]|nr:STAS domain-containing protein [Planosporangium mesophilum]NJC82402.1 STAS domain-containing protein [Planosporangium mesophilum]
MSRGQAWITYRDDALVTIHAHGDIDVTSAALLREVAFEAVTHPGGQGVAVDLSAVTFIDSVGVAALVTAFKTARAAGLPFTVAAASPSATRLLRMTGLAGLWGFAPDDPPSAPNGPLTALTPVG